MDEIEYIPDDGEEERQDISDWVSKHHEDDFEEYIEEDEL